MLKRELVRGIVISNTCVKLYRNWIINEVARAGEHTNERTNVRTYSHTYVQDRPYIPSTTLLCEGITNLQTHWVKFKQLRNLFTTIIRESKKAFHDNLANKLKSDSLSSKQWWTILKSFISRIQNRRYPHSKQTALYTLVIRKKQMFSTIF